MLNKNIKENYEDALNLITTATKVNSDNLGVAASILVLANTISSRDLVDMKDVAKALDNLGYEVNQKKFN